MGLTQCKNHHFYDGGKYSSCPYCNPEEDNDKTVCLQDEQVNETHNLKAATGESQQSEKGIEKPEEQKSMVTVDVQQDCKKQGKSDFVVGWLVCLNGENKGNDYRLNTGMNQIKQVQCSVIYEAISNACYLFPGRDVSISVNETAVNDPKKLNSGDHIEINGNEYVFVAYCHDNIMW